MLAGCIAVMGVAEMMVGAWGSVLVGALASFTSVLTRQLIIVGIASSHGVWLGTVVVYRTIWYTSVT